MASIEPRARALGGLLLLLLATAAGCGRRPETGPGEVRWDRDVCARCSMVISERRHAAQVRGGPAGERSRLHAFDDVGCALIWLDREPWGRSPHVEIWVAGEDGRWLDARSAWFETGVRTPMDYRIAARAEPAEGRLDLERAWEHVRRIDRDSSREAGRPPGPEGEDS